MRPTRRKTTGLPRQGSEKAAVDALAKTRCPDGKDRDYWTAKGVRRREARQRMRALASAGPGVRAKANMAAAAAFDKIGATCNSCHELHLETLTRRFAGVTMMRVSRPLLCSPRDFSSTRST